MSGEDLELTQYSPLWPAVFDLERQRLLEIFGEGVVIEHIGSTAVPGLGGKPIIDMMLGTADIAQVDARIPQLEAEGYRYRPEFEKSVPDRRFFTKLDRPPGKFHLHAVPLEGAYWKRQLMVRDALRRYPQVAQQYGRAKQRAAARHPGDRAAYVEAKAEFIRALLKKLSE